MSVKRCVPSIPFEGGGGKGTIRCVCNSTVPPVITNTMSSSLWGGGGGVKYVCESSVSTFNANNPILKNPLIYLGGGGGDRRRRVKCLCKNGASHSKVNAKIKSSRGGGGGIKHVWIGVGERLNVHMGVLFYTNMKSGLTLAIERHKICTTRARPQTNRGVISPKVLAGN